MIFVDAGAFVGRFLIDDQYHKRAMSLWEKIQAEGESCCTTNFVLDETFTFLARRCNHKFAAEKARLVYSSNEFQILRPTLEEELAAIELFEKYADQKVSFTDCISFALMRRAGAPTAFSFDQHFERAGFKLWS
ncbi:MAG: PIN domain-containing protein [Verrucomicrobiae bacterium]|nr:PIN domain-containing protein [Verrucomicrobiae bacterium]